MKIIAKITSIKILKDMQKQGFIELHEQTGTDVYFWGTKSKCYYVNDGKPNFIYKNKNYITKYTDGCFYPFVYEVQKPNYLILSTTDNFMELYKYLIKKYSFDGINQEANEIYFYVYSQIEYNDLKKELEKELENKFVVSYEYK